ncbi:MAG TPA: M3 family metallopeptidase [Bacteroidaceae bacterium]|nr:M3 family metallopeptidase [Bacteroidaceae bacterium]
MRKSVYIIIIAFMVSCGGKNVNPFFEESSAPFGAIEFDKIESEHYKPAFLEGFRQHKEQIDSIASDTMPTTFENTIEALEASGKLLSRVSGVFFNLNETDADSIMKRTEREITPLFTEHSAYMTMNQRLFEKIVELHNNKDEIGLTREQEMTLEKYYRTFVNGGALLSPDDKKKFIEINTQLGLLTIKFADNVLAETNKYKLHITDRNLLKGIPEPILEAAAENASREKLDGWVFTTQKPLWIPFLQFAENRELRESMYKAYYNRGNNGDEYDNNQIIKNILKLRLDKAKLLGYNTFADYQLNDKMAKTPQAAYNLLMTIWKEAISQAKREVADLQAIIDNDNGGFKLEAWDWWYYTEKARRNKYSFDENELKPYFSLENVKNGAFMVANKLFGVSFNKLSNIPVYNPEVEVYECIDEDGSHLSLFYTDCFTRDTKRQGAWMNNIVEQSNLKGVEIRPSIINVCNFQKPLGDTPCLLSVDDAKTLFHEFGHALHGMLTKTNYPSVSGTNVPRDFVELCSQIMEHWAVEPEVLKQYAFHYKTGEPIPDNLIQKMSQATNFNTGFETVELVAAAILDMELHMLDDYSNYNPEEFENRLAKKIGMIDQIEYRYKSTIFNHIFNSGYSAGYYSYLWAELLDADAFELFKERGIFDQKTGRSFRRNILEKGGSEDPMVLYKLFRGAEPNPDALLKTRGLKR